MSWIECSMSVPPPACATSPAPRRAVQALDREVLVVAHHRRERAAVLAATRPRRAMFRNTGAQRSTRPT